MQKAKMWIYKAIMPMLTRYEKLAFEEFPNRVFEDDDQRENEQRTLINLRESIQEVINLTIHQKNGLHK